MSMPVTLVEPGTVRLERLLPGPIERVWAYLTEPDKRARWLAGGEFELRVGGRARLEFDNDSLSSDKVRPEKYKAAGTSKYEGRITRLEPMRLLAFTWTWESGDTEVTFELSPRGRQVQLVVVHRRLDGQAMPMNVMSGWDVHSGILEDVLNGVEPRPFWKTHSELERRYAAAL